MEIREKVRVIFEAIMDGFVNPIGKANQKLKNFNGQLAKTSNRMQSSAVKIQSASNNLHTLNKRLALQKIKYGNVNSEIAKLNSQSSTLKNSTQKITKAQSDQLNTINKDVSALKAKRTAITNTMNTTKGGIATANRSIDTTKDTAAANMGFFKTMRLNGEQFKELGGRQHLMTKRMGKFAFATRKAFHGLRGFKMEMLGVMFFGMSMVRLFGGLTKESMEWFGVMDILSMALGILFLPLAKKLMEWALKFLKWVSKLTPKQKKMINMFVAAALAVGLLLTVFGTLALGIGSLMLAFHFLFSPIGLILTALAALAGYIFLSSMFDDVGDAVEKVEGKLIAFGVSADVIEEVKDKFNELRTSLSESIIVADLRNDLYHL